MTLPGRPALLAASLALAVLAGMAWAADVPAAPGAPALTAQAGQPSVSSQEPIRPAQVRPAPAPRPEARPTWTELTPQQQASLAPLSATWATLGAAHKRKWLALSENFHTMPAAEQARLHSRMTEWAALSAQQRNAARLNFAEAKKVAPEDKRAKWEAYQALPPEEKKRLAARAAAAKPPPPPTAIAVRPVPRDKLAKIPPKARTRTDRLAPRAEAPAGAVPPAAALPAAAAPAVATVPAQPVAPAPQNNALQPSPGSPTAP